MKELPLSRRAGGRSSARRARRPRRRHLLETLEDRRLLAAIDVEVTTGMDVVDPSDGLISLREAINMANANPDQATITFRSDVTLATLTKTTGIDILDNNVNGDLDLNSGEVV